MRLGETEEEYYALGAMLAASQPPEPSPGEPGPGETGNGEPGPGEPSQGQQEGPA